MGKKKKVGTASLSTFLSPVLPLPSLWYPGDPGKVRNPFLSGLTPSIQHTFIYLLGMFSVSGDGFEWDSVLVLRALS